MTQKLRQRGLSLVELLIAMALGVVLTLGVVQIFLGNSQTYRMTDAMARMQENVRFSLEYLKYELRLAGYRGCTTRINNLLAADAANPGAGGFFMGQALQGWEYANTGPGGAYDLVLAGPGDFQGGGADFPAELAGNVMAGSDVFVVNRAQRLPVVVESISGTTIKLDDSADIKQGSILVATNDTCSGGDMFQKTNNDNSADVTKGVMGGFTPGNNNSPGNPFTQNYGPGATILVNTSTAYFIGENPNGDPALYRYVFDATGSGSAEELVDGVESMQVLYGVSTGINGRVGSYVTANNVANWDDVVSLRIAFLMRSQDATLNFGAEDEDPTFNLAGTVIDVPNDRRARLVGTTTVAIRSRAN
ncbi:PilW family protein [Hydrocarboniclastica marina]|uniref:Prepilin-type N-terminal cleavage/methylation domain-containing protein n=1 Tax=Hydrocarboniclastica marina TaxID=2259620 RepID=A0A4P7XLR2_9ALTE|nr:PilW family protein [Hydrocarboniclastica marina]QCF27803.1 prepilin-type N-terminal cleavage/methylation domain-containing protein [Hydrocarboniclastica marina]